MDKKKHGLLAWYIIVIITMLVAIGGFVFGFVKEGIGLWTTSIKDNPGMYVTSFGNCLVPVINGFTKVIVDVKDPIFYVLVSYLGVIGLLLIVFVIAAIAKKNAKYLWHVIPYLIFATVGLYFICVLTINDAVGAYDPKQSPLLMLINGKKGPLAVGLGFNLINRIQPYIAWPTLVFIGLFILSILAYAIMLIIRATNAKEELVTEEDMPVENLIKPTEDKTKTIAIPTVPMITPAVVEESEPVVEEPVEEKPKRKVFLVVKRYNASADSVEAVVEDKKPENLTADDIREIIRSEHEAYENRRIAEEASRNFDKVNQASTCAPAETHETRTVAPSPVKDEVKAPVTPIIIAIPDPVVDDDEEVPSQTQENTKSSPVNRDQIRDIVRDELKRAIEKIVSIPQETVVTETVEEVEETPVATGTETIAVLDEKNVPVDVKEEPAPVAETEPETEKTSEPIERISFADRIRKADDEMKDNYNKIKSLLMSYGLKNRVSNGGDAFRLHKVTYAKIAVAGKSLKIYLALDPADYKNTTLPIKDASSKAIYKEIPLVFKVKSGLSMRRCEQLISEMMDKHHIDQVDRVIEKDYVALLDVNTDDDDE